MCHSICYNRTPKVFVFHFRAERNMPPPLKRKKTTDHLRNHIPPNIPSCTHAGPPCNPPENYYPVPNPIHLPSSAFIPILTRRVLLVIILNLLKSRVANEEFVEKCPTKSDGKSLGSAHDQSAKGGHGSDAGRPAGDRAWAVEVGVAIDESFSCHFCFLRMVMVLSCVVHRGSGEKDEQNSTVRNNKKWNYELERTRTPWISRNQYNLRTPS